MGPVRRDPYRNCPGCVPPQSDGAGRHCTALAVPAAAGTQDPVASPVHPRPPRGRVPAAPVARGPVLRSVTADLPCSPARAAVPAADPASGTHPQRHRTTPPAYQHRRRFPAGRRACRTVAGPLNPDRNPPMVLAAGPHPAFPAPAQAQIDSVPIRTATCQITPIRPVGSPNPDPTPARAVRAAWHKPEFAAPPRGRCGPRAGSPGRSFHPRRRPGHRLAPERAPHRSGTVTRLGLPGRCQPGRYDSRYPGTRRTGTQPARWTGTVFPDPPPRFRSCAPGAGRNGRPAPARTRRDQHRVPAPPPCAWNAGALCSSRPGVGAVRSWLTVAGWHAPTTRVRVARSAPTAFVPRAGPGPPGGSSTP